MKVTSCYAHWMKNDLFSIHWCASLSLFLYLFYINSEPCQSSFNDATFEHYYCCFVHAHPWLLVFDRVMAVEPLLVNMVLWASFLLLVNVFFSCLMLVALLLELGSSFYDAYNSLVQFEDCSLVLRCKLGQFSDSCLNVKNTPLTDIHVLLLSYFFTPLVAYIKSKFLVM